LSRRLRTPSLPTTHASVGHWWQNTRLCPLFVKVITATHATSCRTPTSGSAAPPQNHLLPGQDRLNNQRLFRLKIPQRWRRLHPLLGELAHGRCQPTLNFFDDTVLPDGCCKCCHDLAVPRPSSPTKPQNQHLKTNTFTVQNLAAVRSGVGRDRTRPLP
jgi:hypothetical protein